MRLELGTVMASTPSAERVRRRNVFLLRRSSIEETVTGDLRKSSLRTGSSRMRSRSALVTVGCGLGGYNWVAPLAAEAHAAAAAVWRNWRREVLMGLS